MDIQENRIDTYVQERHIQIELKNLLERNNIPFKQYYITKESLCFDFYLPENQIAFNIVHPVQHITNHPDFPRSRQHLKEQQQKALDIGIQLFNLWFHWDIDKTLSFVWAKLNLFNKKYYARNLIATRITSRESQPFFNSYHIHGYALASDTYALITRDGEILQAVSFRKSHIHNVTECARLSTKSRIQIVGGSAKLFTFALKDLKSKGYTKVISYAYRDLTPSPENSVYSRLHFTFKGFTIPGLFFYVLHSFETPNGSLLKRGVYFRHKFQTHKLEKDFGFKNFHAGDLKSVGIYELYDSGNLSFELKL